jgi:enterochelin esterase-like enzyme
MLIRRALVMMAVLFTITAFPSLAAAKDSQVLQLSVDSTYTKRKMPCMVYLPKGYGGGDRYAVWYGLHGSGSNESMWINNVGVARTTNELIEAGAIKPLIMVFPLTRYDSMKEVQENMDKDGKFGEQNMDQFVYKELVPYVDSHFDTVPSADGRYIGGFSMGGMIALRIAFRHPEVFSKVGGFSAAVPSSDYSGRQLEAWLYPNDNVDEIADIAAFDKEKGFDTLRVYLDCGTAGDPFFNGLQSLKECLQKKGIHSEFHTFEGGHDISHAIRDFREYLKFYNPL